MIKQVTTEKRFCDICEATADGTWHSTAYLNGNIQSTLACPLDLCENHMRIWATNLSRTAVDSYPAPYRLTEAEIANIIQELRPFCEVQP